MIRTRMSKGQAMKRISRARKLIGKRTLQGEVLPPEWEHTAAALSRGEIGDEHVEVIRKFFRALPSFKRVNSSRTSWMYESTWIDLERIRDLGRA